MSVWSLEECYEVTCDSLNVWGSEAPRLVKTGLDAVDRSTGGLEPGAVMLLAADTGVGKSSLMADSVLRSPHKVGIISLEDSPVTLFSRLWMWKAGLNPLALRMGTQHSKSEYARERMRIAYKAFLAEKRITLAFPIGKPLESVLEAFTAMCEIGCEIVWVDYVQEIRGHHSVRRDEVAASATALHGAAASAKVPVVMLSQFSRRQQRHREEIVEPTLANLKESGDLENKGHVVVLGWDAGDGVIDCKIAKAKNGLAPGHSPRFSYRRDHTGRPVPL